MIFMEKAMIEIKNIEKISYEKEIPVYCVSIPKDDEVLIRGSKTGNSYRCGQCNFGLIFGAGGQTIKRVVIEPNWSSKECGEYILENKLKIEKDSMTHKPDPMLTVAKDIREKFFEAYPELANWHRDYKSKSANQGYITSIYGAIRRLPQLLYQGEEDDYGLVSNLESICLNSPIQNMESVIMTQLMLKVHYWLKENNMKSRFFGAVHDAVELYVFKDEAKEVSRKIKELFELAREEFNGIPLEMEGNIADYYGTKDSDNWELWDLGHDWGDLIDGSK
jgi:hypothetical protein